MNPADLEKRLNTLIAADIRPPRARNTFSKRTGQKRTHIESVRIIPASQLAGALPIKQQTQTAVANAGDTAWGTFTTGPLTADAINQGQLSDCYLLIAMYLVARLRPNFFDDIFVKVDDQTAIVQWYLAGSIVQIKTSLLISTDYDHPTNGDVRPELAEKTWCLIKAGISDYAQDNFGMIDSVFTALGLDGSLGTLTSDAIIAALQAGCAVGLQTTPTVTGKNSLENWVESHAYGVTAFDPVSKNLTLAQPWYADKQITGVDPATVSGGAVFNLMHLGAFPAMPRILAGMVNVAADPAPAITPIAVPAAGLTITADKASALANCRLATLPGGKAEIGSISGAAFAEFQLNLAAAGVYTVSVEAAAVAAAAVDVSVNSIIAAPAVTLPVSGAWTVFATVPVSLTLPAGNVTLRISNRNATQYNLGNITLSPVAPVLDDPIIAISVTTKRKSGALATTTVL